MQAFLDEEDRFALGSLDFSGLDSTQFEEFCLDLVSASGFNNVDWRKGTPATHLLLTAAGTSSLTAG